MAINPESQYPGKINPSDADYPYGSARNITVPGDGTGTPWEAAIVNDNLGFQQALLEAAGIVPSGTPDKVGASQYLDSLFATTRRFALTTAAMAAAKNPKVGQFFSTLEFATGYGLDSGANYQAVLTSGVTPNGRDVIVSTEDATISFVLASRMFANVKQFGARGAGTDDTAAIRAAMAFLDNQGGGTCYFPNGTYALFTTDTPSWCVRIPDNVNIVGESRGGVIIQRLNFDDANFMFVNDRADTATGYGAASNITIENLTLRMSSGSEVTATEGDLIAIGHGENITVRNCNFGKHGQHCVDIGGCRNVIIEGNYEDNDNGATGAAENSAYQVDSANAAAFQGINVDGTESENVTIANNHMINLNTNTLVHVGHNGGTARNVTIRGNYFKGTSRAFGKFIRTDTDDASIDGLVIEGNTFESVSNANVAIISLITNGNNSEFLKNIVIANNTLIGLARIGIDIGASTSYAGLNLPPIENIVIANNTIDVDFTGATVLNAGIQANLLKNTNIKGNNIKVTKDTDSVDLFGIRCITANNVNIAENVIATELAAFVGTQLTAGIKVDRFGAVATSAIVDVKVSGNMIDVSDYDYGIHNEFLNADDLVLLSGNRFNGDLVNGDAHIFESIPTSDGTNGYRPVDLTGAGGYILDIGVDTEYAITTGLIKKTTGNFVRSKEVIDVSYASAGTSNLSTDTEDFTDNTSNIAFQVQKINPTAGSFSIVTGGSGITATFNAGGAASTRVSGAISVRAGI